MYPPWSMVRCEMYRKLRGSFESDEGMSVLEVVLAAFILFFVLTAILGLVATSTQMGLQAKQRTAATNAISSHLEWMRSLPFEEMAIRGTTPEAAVDSQVVVQEGDFTITITTQVLESQGETKEVRVSAVITAPGYEPKTYTSTSIVRDREAGITNLTSSGTGPLVEFAPSTPEADAVVYAALAHTTNMPLFLSLHAAAEENASMITELRMYCEGTLLRDGSTTFAAIAAWTPMTSPVDQSFKWDTRQLDDNGDLAIPDGWRLVRALATSDSGKQSTVERRFYVDNYPPGNPGVPVAAIYSDVETRISWTVAMDGTDPAVRYLVHTNRVGEDGTLGGSMETFAYSAVHLQTTDPFSRYTVSVAATTPRNEKTGFFEIVAPYVSRPHVTGDSTTVYTGEKTRRSADITVNLTTSQPTFAATNVSYDLYRGTSADTLKNGAAYLTNVDPNFTETYTDKCGKDDPVAYYYAYKITFTPSGYKGGTAESIWSNIVGPTTAADDVLTPMAHVSW